MKNVFIISVIFALLTFPVFSQAGGGSTVNRIANRLDDALTLGSTKKIVNNAPSYTGIHTKSTIKAPDVLPSRAITTSTRKALASSPTIPSTSASTGFARQSTEKITLAKPLRDTVSDIKQKTRTGLSVSEHSIQQKINRQVSSANELAAIKKPLSIKPTKIDHLGRPSQRYIGEKAEVAINPETKKIVSVNPTSSKKAERLMHQTKSDK